MQQTDHYHLVRDCLKHKRHAQKRLYDHFVREMLGVCFRYTKSMADAEEVLQEGFVKIFTRLHQFRYEGELGAWIRRIMVTTALNFLKTNRRYRYDLSFDEMPLHAVSNEDPQLKLQAKELAELIRQLPTGFQTIFNLHAVEGYKHKEIAEMLGISEGTSRSQYARARTILCEWIEKFSLENQSGRYGTK